MQCCSAFFTQGLSGGFDPVSCQMERSRWRGTAWPEPDPAWGGEGDFTCCAEGQGTRPDGGGGTGGKALTQPHRGEKGAWPPPFSFPPSVPPPPPPEKMGHGLGPTWSMGEAEWLGLQGEKRAWPGPWWEGDIVCPSGAGVGVDMAWLPPGVWGFGFRNLVGGTVVVLWPPLPHSQISGQVGSPAG